MLAEIISTYLEGNRRLVIPQLGAFLVKEPDHTLVFSQLIKRDDGVLLALLAQRGVSEVEASGMIQRLIFDVHFVQESGGELLLGGLGRFYLGDEGELKFDSVSAVESTPEIEPEPIEEPLNEVAEQCEDAAVQAAEESSESESVEEENTPNSSPASEQRADTTITSRGFEPDPDLEGLTYGTRRYRSPSMRPGDTKRSVDIWMIVAIASVALALGAILYGFLRDGAGFSVQDSYTEQGL